MCVAQRIKHLGLIMSYYRPYLMPAVLPGDSPNVLAPRLERTSAGEHTSWRLGGRKSRHTAWRAHVLSHVLLYGFPFYSKCGSGKHPPTPYR